MTGGMTSTSVTAYDVDGWVEDLPDLMNYRNSHACGHYVDANNNMV